METSSLSDLAHFLPDMEAPVEFGEGTAVESPPGRLSLEAFPLNSAAEFAGLTPPLPFAGKQNKQ